MIRYEIKIEHDSKNIPHFVVEKYSQNASKNKVINSASEYEDILMRFINQGFNVAIIGNTLVLKNNSTIININDYKAYYECQYLKKLREAINKKVDLRKLEKTNLLRQRENLKNQIESKKKKKNNPFKRVATRLIAGTSAISLALGIYGGCLFYKNNNTKNINNDRTISYTQEIENPPVITDKIREKSLASINSMLMATGATMTIMNQQKNGVIEESNVTEEKEKEEKMEVKEITPSSVGNNYELYLKQYSTYFNLDSDKIIEFAKTISENYTKPFKDILNTSCKVEEPEAVAAVICSKAYANKFKKLGYPESYFSNGSSIRTMDNTHILDSGLSFTEFYGYIADLLGADKYYTLAICLLESGRLTSDITYSKNNFGGIGGHGHYSSFPTPEAGIIAHIRILKEYESKNFQNIEQLSAYYVNGINIKGMSTEEAQNYIARTWVNNVKSIRNEIINKENTLFKSIEEVRKLLLQYNNMDLETNIKKIS